MNNSKIDLTPKKVVLTLSIAAVLLVLAGIAANMFTMITGHESLYGILPKFDLNAEQNIPTYFSSLLLLLAAVLLGTIAVSKKKENDPYLRHWALLSVIFLFLSLDEAASLHELLNVIGLIARTKGIFLFSWVIVAVPLLIFFAIYFLRFLFQLPGKTKALFIMGGILYCGGALGMEFIGGRYISGHGPDSYYTLAYIILTTIEETLEMTGAIVFIYGLLDYARTYLSEITLRLSTDSK